MYVWTGLYGTNNQLPIGGSATRLMRTPTKTKTDPWTL
jgi:hypothetical protein